MKESSRLSSSPTGPFTTGCCDVMVGKDEKGVLMRIFYPCKYDNIDDHKDKWTKWFLGSQYSKGLGIFFLPWMYPGYHFFTNVVTKNTYIPSVWEAPLKDGKFPLVIFSHGLAAHRSMYSSICNDIASHGFIVAAVEHRDRSACATFVLNQSGKKKWILVKPVLSRKYEFDVRFRQIKVRSDEVSRALDALESLNRGEVALNELSSALPLSAFKGKIDTERTILAGHSFGGATTILALSRDKRFRAGICLDPWLFPLEAFHRCKNVPSDADIAEMNALSETVKQPLLFILMESFQDKKNLMALKKFETKTRNKCWTLIKALHQNQTDTPMLFRNDGVLLKSIVGCSSDIHPDTAMKLNNNLMINFISHECDLPNPYSEEYDDYIFKNNRWAIEGARGTAKYMPGWHRRVIRK